MTSSSSLRYEFFALTDTGRVRSNNEDAVAFYEAAQLALLADGMGGYNAGEVASSMAVAYVGSEMARWLETAGRTASAAQVRQALQTCINQVNQTILNASRNEAQYQGMGTTLVACVFHRRKLIVGHIGDSRCYRLRAGVLQAITRDHSWLQEQVDAGVLTPEEAARSGQRNLLTRALGVEEEVLLEINEFMVEPDDIYLLCSDGLSEMVSHAALQEIVHQPWPLQEKAQRLIEQANAMGGRDNISALLVHASEESNSKRGFLSKILRS